MTHPGQTTMTAIVAGGAGMVGYYYYGYYYGSDERKPPAGGSSSGTRLGWPKKAPMDPAAPTARSES
jgi:hypothetical protein